MPTASETVPNRRLSGAELKQLLIDDWLRLLDSEGMLNHYVAYGRVGYTISYELHLDNVLMPNVRGSQASRPVAGNLPAAPGFGVLEAPPLVALSPPAARDVCSNCHDGIESHTVNADETWHCDLPPAGDYIALPETPEVAAQRLDRLVTSPNFERQRLGLPVTIDVKEPNGQFREERLLYERDPALGEGDVTVTDLSADARAKWAGLDEPVG